MPEDTGWSGFTRRRVSVIAAAIAAVILAGLVYLRPGLPYPVADLTPSAVPTMNGPFSATFDFLTPSLGWSLVVDYSAYNTRFWLFRTDDGAAHWDRQFFGRAVGDRTYLHFFDAQNGFAYAGRSYRTTDGGAHWLILNLPKSFTYVTFASPTNGWAEAFVGGSERLFKTADGGANWTPEAAVPPGAAVLQPLIETQTSPFRAGGEGWLGADHQRVPTVFVTQDGGATWQTLLMTSAGYGYDSPTYGTTVRLLPDGGVVAFVRDENARLLGAFMTSDGGTTWRQVFFPTRLGAAADVSFLDADHWWLFQSGNIYRTDNAGSSWLYVKSSGLPDGWNFAGARAIDQRHAWWTLISSASSVLTALALTFDGGEHWSTVSIPMP